MLIEAKFQQSKADACLYTRKFGDKWCYLLIYVDDMTLMAKSTEIINEVKKFISSKFELEDLGDIKYYLGIEINKSVDGYYQLCQSNYINKIAFDYGLADAKESNVPISVNYGKTTKVEDEKFLTDNTAYQKLIGSLLYVAVNTRPDIAASVSILSQRVCAPRQEDWNGLKRVVKYLKGTANLKLTLGDKQSNEMICGYADANWAEDRFNRKSNSGYIFKVFGGPVSWACRKQNCVALSSTEAEFIALSEACQEAVWIKRLLTEMHLDIKLPINIFEDNQSCLNLIKEEKLSNRTKHIDTRYNFVKDYIEKKIVSCTYCSTERMVADILTKPLPATKHLKLRKLCGLHD